MQLQIKVENVNQVRAGLQQLPDYLIEEGSKEIPNVLEKVKRSMQAYPPRRPKQKYKRTYKLRDNWKIERDGRKKKWTISNRARFKGKEYVHWVVGDALGNRQAWMHKKRWRVFRVTFDKFLGPIMTDVNSRVNAAIRAKGFS